MRTTYVTQASHFQSKPEKRDRTLHTKPTHQLPNLTNAIALSIKTIEMRSLHCKFKV
ncbi:MAG: hypothetical protein HC785_10660 [Calothrix sp. CSU_2_0]|nr:hypothetical protein [Calothrix sp. CSU_2_0]